LLPIWSVLSSSEFEEKNGIIEGGLGHASKRGSGIGEKTNPTWSHWVSIDETTRNVKCK